MPLPILAEAFFKGLPIVSIVFSILKIVPWLVIIYLLKTYFSGARNTSERLMHSKIIMITVYTIREMILTSIPDLFRVEHPVLGLLLLGP